MRRLSVPPKTRSSPCALLTIVMHRRAETLQEATRRVVYPRVDRQRGVEEVEEQEDKEDAVG